MQVRVHWWQVLSVTKASAAIVSVSSRVQIHSADLLPGSVILKTGAQGPHLTVQWIVTLLMAHYVTTIMLIAIQDSVKLTTISARHTF